MPLNRELSLIVISTPFDEMLQLLIFSQKFKGMQMFRVGATKQTVPALFTNPLKVQCHLRSKCSRMV